MCESLVVLADHVSAMACGFRTPRGGSTKIVHKHHRAVAWIIPTCVYVGPVCVHACVCVCVRVVCGRTRVAVGAAAALRTILTGVARVPVYYRAVTHAWYTC